MEYDQNVGVRAAGSGMHSPRHQPSRSSYIVGDSLAPLLEYLSLGADTKWLCNVPERTIPHRQKSRLDNAMWRAWYLYHVHGRAIKYFNFSGLGNVDDAAIRRPGYTIFEGLQKGAVKRQYQKWRKWSQDARKKVIVKPVAQPEARLEELMVLDVGLEGSLLDDFLADAESGGGTTDVSQPKNISGLVRAIEPSFDMDLIDDLFPDFVSDASRQQQQQHQASALEKALLDLQTLSGGYYEFDTLAPAMQYTNPDLSTATRQRTEQKQQRRKDSHDKQKPYYADPKAPKRDHAVEIGAMLGATPPVAELASPSSLTSHSPSSAGSMPHLQSTHSSFSMGSSPPIQAGVTSGHMISPNGLFIPGVKAPIIGMQQQTRPWPGMPMASWQYPQVQPQLQRKLSVLQPSTMRPPGQPVRLLHPPKRPRGRPRKYPKEGQPGAPHPPAGGPMRQASLPLGTSPYVAHGVRPQGSHQMLGNAPQSHAIRQQQIQRLMMLQKQHSELLRELQLHASDGYSEFDTLYPQPMGHMPSFAQPVRSMSTVDARKLGSQFSHESVTSVNDVLDFRNAPSDNSSKSPLALFTVGSTDDSPLMEQPSPLSSFHAQYDGHVMQQATSASQMNRIPSIPESVSGLNIQSTASSSLPTFAQPQHLSTSMSAQNLFVLHQLYAQNNGQAGTALGQVDTQVQVQLPAVPTGASLGTGLLHQGAVALGDLGAAATLALPASSININQLLTQPAWPASLMNTGLTATVPLSRSDEQQAQAALAALAYLQQQQQSVSAQSLLTPAPSTDRASNFGSQTTELTTAMQMELEGEQSDNSNDEDEEILQEGQVQRKLSAHQLAEQKRRHAIKAAFQQMETMVPMPGEGQKPSKATILQSTIEHIQALETDSTELTDEATRLRGEINALRVSFSQNQAPSVEDPRDVNARQLYRAYLHKYAGANMKFWIFARQFDDLFEPYMRAIDVVTPEAMQKSFLNWVGTGIDVEQIRHTASETLPVIGALMFPSKSEGPSDQRNGAPTIAESASSVASDAVQQDTASAVAPAVPMSMACVDSGTAAALAAAFQAAGNAAGEKGGAQAAMDFPAFIQSLAKMATPPAQEAPTGGNDET